MVPRFWGTAMAKRGFVSDFDLMGDLAAVAAVGEAIVVAVGLGTDGAVVAAGGGATAEPEACKAGGGVARAGDGLIG